MELLQGEGGSPLLAVVLSQLHYHELPKGIVQVGRIEGPAQCFFPSGKLPHKGLLHKKLGSLFQAHFLGVHTYGTQVPAIA